MRRHHLFEWEDQPWLPRVFRDFITDHLLFTQSEPMRRPINRAIAERLKNLLNRVNTVKVIDLCSGAAGPWGEISRILATELSMPVEVLLTDLYPHIEGFKRIEAASEGKIRGRYESTSALDVPKELVGVRTLFTAFHHFPPELARQVLRDAVRKRAAIAVFEPLERTVRLAVLVGLMSMLRGFTHTPRVGTLTVSRLVLTYLVPLAPAMFAWDGMVSALRTYTPGELLELANSVEAQDYTWESGRFEVSGPFGPMPTIFLVGCPSSVTQAPRSGLMQYTAFSVHLIESGSRFL